MYAIRSYYVMQRDEIENIKLSDRDISLMTFELVLRDNELADNFVKEIANQIQDEDVRDMMLFVSPVFSKEESVSTEFIESLNKVENRKKENWVLTALAYFHHAYHKESNIRYLSSALDRITSYNVCYTKLLRATFKYFCYKIRTR